jgi:hypothetical protein
MVIMPPVGSLMDAPSTEVDSTVVERLVQRLDTTDMR